jgi:cell fate (sporulation/competence/biofilm development) regulator YmcA (YheA/YmcA/DUF963 family)
MQPTKKSSTYNYSLKELRETSSKNVYYRCAACKRVQQTPSRYYYEGKTCANCSPKEPKVSTTVLTSDIRRVVKELNKQPTLAEYLKHSKYTRNDLKKAFGKDWEDILAQLGYKVAKKTYSYQEVVQELEKVAKSLRKLPTIQEFHQKAKIDANIVLTISNSTTWMEVLEKVFRVPKNILEVVLNSHHPYYQEQLSRLKTVSDKLKRIPTIPEAIKYGIKVDLLAKRLNKSWIEILELSGIAIDNDVIATISQTKRFIKNEEMLEDINLVAKELGYYPDDLKYDLLGAYSANNIIYRFNASSWISVIDLAKSRDVLPETSLITQEKTSIHKSFLEYFDIDPSKDTTISLEKYNF